jgi:hypothetical protein
MNQDMNVIKIDNVEYDIDKFSDEAKTQLLSLQFCDQELTRLQAQSAALQTARQAYANALKTSLDPIAGLGEMIIFN